jgi:hypothetical protein
VRARALIAAASLLLAGCAAPEPSPTPTTASPVAECPPGDELSAELLAMLERDQAGRSGGQDLEGDPARTERLRDILDGCGWPTFSLVGEEAEDAAWTIAQHSDHDVGFQRRALELLADAVAAGDASPGNLAYLTDRVAVNSGEPQTYATQVACINGLPEVAGGLIDEPGVDARRAEVGLAPLADYFAELAEVCASEG